MKTLTRVLVLGILVLIVGSALTPSQKIPADLEITLQRTVCFGTCPDYTLRIRADRTVVFTGGEFTEKKGTAKSRITKSQLKMLVKEFERVNLESYADDYSQGGFCESYITDLPSEIFSIKRHGKTKTVNHYFGCIGKTVQDKLKALTELGRTIDKVTNSRRWVGK